MEPFFLCLDVGGTELKAAPVTPDGRILAELVSFPAQSALPKEALLAHLREVFQQLTKRWPEAQGLRLAFPGPFDYETGVSLMQGIGKYEAIYRYPLKPFLAEAAGVSDILFCNDVGAFALGELHFGAAAGTQRAMFLCIGTGCGSAFSTGGQLTGSETPGVPHHGYVYDTPFLGSCIDDYLSKRGIEALTQERLGTALDGRALAQRAAHEPAAKACFLLFGERLRDAMLSFLDGFRPECLCLGGQIIKSGPLFLAPLEEACAGRGIRLAVSAETSRRALQGLTCLPSQA